MGFDDRPTNGKSYPHSFGFCREERLKDTLLDLTSLFLPESPMVTTTVEDA